MKKYILNLMRLSLALVVVMSSNLTFAQENIVVASVTKPVVKDEVIVTAGDLAEVAQKRGGRTFVYLFRIGRHVFSHIVQNPKCI